MAAVCMCGKVDGVASEVCAAWKLDGVACRWSMDVWEGGWGRVRSRSSMNVLEGGCKS